MAFLNASPVRLQSKTAAERCMNRGKFPLRYRLRATLSRIDTDTPPIKSDSKDIHLTALSAATAIFELVARGTSGKVHVHVDIVGVLVRGLTHASCAHPHIAPLSQEHAQAHADVCRRGLALENQSERTLEEETELALLDKSALALDEGNYARGDNVAIFSVADDHPDEQWLTINVSSPPLKSNGIIDNDSSVVQTERAVRAFVESIIAGQRVCPYTESADIAAVGAASLTPAPIRYVTDSGPSDCASLIEATLQAAKEMLNTPKTDISTVLLLLPQFDDFTSFSACCAYMADVLVHCGIRREIDIVLFHPQYERTALDCNVELIGHLPQPGQLASRAIATSRDNAVKFSPHELAKAVDFSRRAPVPIVNILRGEQLQELSASNAHGALYVRNAERLAAIGVDELQRQLNKWIAMARDG